MKKLTLLTLLSITALLSNAQYVTIPDSNFVKFLQAEFPSAMSGNQMDTTAAAITGVKQLWVYADNIKSIKGVEHMDSLEELNCSYLYLLSLPKLPQSLISLDCSGNGLYSLPKLPNNLRKLDCRSNNLDSLPNLPDSLEELQCNDNEWITRLPVLPSKLKKLYCGYMSLTTLPALPNSLIDFFCGYNTISHLPKLPDNLKRLDYRNNKQISIPLALPQGLEQLDCSDSHFGSLPVLPDSLWNLRCVRNGLTSLPRLPQMLRALQVTKNNLKTLPDLPDNLWALRCDSNQLEVLPSLPDSLTWFICSDNPQLSCLPHFSQTNFQVFKASSNTQIKCLPKKITIEFVLFPSLMDSSRYLPVCTPNSGCPIAYNISGNLHQDTSVNCATDSLNNGPRLSGVKMLQYINDTLRGQAYTDINGFYSFEAETGDSTIVKIDTVNSFFVSCPVSGKREMLVTATDSLFENQDFGVKCAGVDLGVLSIQGTFRPTRNRPVYIRAGDLSHQFDLGCGDGVSGTVSTTISGSANFVSPLFGALTPTSVVGKTLIYTISDFGAIDLDSAFNIVVNTDSNAVVGSNICIKTKVNTSVSDINSNNDSLLFCGEVVNSYDPNDKAAYPSDVATPDTWITYTVRFQNTGTDTAYQVIIRDTLSPYLDESTFTYLDGSVRPVVSLNQKAIMFNYPHINLLDSFSNEPESHGWVQYKVKTVAELPPFAEIENTAFIYFDLNSAVVTNTTINEYIIRSSQNITSCDSALVNGEMYTSSQTVIDTLGPNVITTSLVINESKYKAQSFTSCDSIDYQGTMYFTSQIIRDTLSTVSGCDSLVLTNLTINTVNANTTLSGEIISSTQADAQYQWLDCDSSYGIIDLETTQSFTATRNGEYAVEVSNNGCIDTSSCVGITTLSITESNLNESFKIYPNPTKGNITIAFNENHSHIQARILSITGQEISIHTTSNSNTLQFDFEATKGIYFVEITTENGGKSVVRVVKE